MRAHIPWQQLVIYITASTKNIAFCIMNVVAGEIFHVEDSRWMRSVPEIGGRRVGAWQCRCRQQAGNLLHMPLIQGSSKVLSQQLSHLSYTSLTTLSGDTGTTLDDETVATPQLDIAHIHHVEAIRRSDQPPRCDFRKCEDLDGGRQQVLRPARAHGLERNHRARRTYQNRARACAPSALPHPQSRAHTILVSAIARSRFTALKLGQ